MARIRTIKPSLYSSLTVCAWSVAVRWTFVGLFTYVDDAGRGLDEPRLIKSELYPLDDAMTPRKVNEHLCYISESGPVCRYSVDGKRFIHITSWSEHQRINRPTPTKIPPCPIHDGLTEDSLSPHAKVCREGKGREGKGRETSADETFHQSSPSVTRGSDAQIAKTQHLKSVNG